MATDSIMGLFTTPEQYQQAQNQAALQRGVQLAQLDPMQATRAQLYSGGYQLGGAIGSALGAEDPMLKMQSMRALLLGSSQIGIELGNTSGGVQCGQ